MTTKQLTSDLTTPATNVRNIGIFAYPGVELLDIGGATEVFAFANVLLQLQNRTTDPVYQVEVFAEQAGAITTLSGLQIIAQRSCFDVGDDEIDTLIIPGGGVFDGKHVSMPPCFKNPLFIEWIRTKSARVRRLASICTGAFALAESGLLNGRKATTHWYFCQRLAQEYPQIQVEPNQIFIREDNIFTSGGITAGIDLTLALLEEDWGHELTLAVARFLVVFLKRPGGQSQFSNYLTAEASSRTDLRALQIWIIANLEQDLKIETLAARVCMSPRNFARLFLAETGMTPAKYVEMARIDAARHHLETSQLSVEAIAAKTGFEDSERMRRAFMRQIGVSPKYYRDRFSPDAALLISMNPKRLHVADG